jgi:hypothetical protein
MRYNGLVTLDIEEHLINNGESKVRQEKLINRRTGKIEACNTEFINIEK